MQENGINVRDSVQIDLQKLLRAYLRKWWLIGACALFVGLAVLLYTMNFVTPTYRTNITVIVNNSNTEQIIEEITGTNLSASQKLVNTYSAIVKSPSVLERVAEQDGLDYSVEQLVGMITTQQINETELFYVYVTHTNGEEAKIIADTIGQVALPRIEELVEGSSAKVVDYASVPRDRYSPNYSRSGIVGAAIGTVIALIYVTMRYLLDVRLKTSEDMEAIFDLPVLGQIPVFVSEESKGKSGYEYKSRKSGYGYENHDAGKEQDK